MKPDLLAWPDSWKNRNSFQRYFADFPVIGTDNRTRGIFQKILKKRLPGEMLAWIQYEDMAVDHRVISALIQKTFGWENDLFLPDDECSVLFYEFPGLELSFCVEFTSCLVDMKLATDSTQWEQFHTLRYVDFLKLLGNETCGIKNQ